MGPPCIEFLQPFKQPALTLCKGLLEVEQALCPCFSPCLSHWPGEAQKQIDHFSKLSKKLLCFSLFAFAMFTLHP